MEEEKYFPKFIASWKSFDWGVKIYSITDIISLEGAEARTMEVIEATCSGLNNLLGVIKELSIDWNAEQVSYILDLFIEKK